MIMKYLFYLLLSTFLFCSCESNEDISLFKDPSYTIPDEVNFQGRKEKQDRDLSLKINEEMTKLLISMDIKNTESSQNELSYSFEFTPIKSKKLELTRGREEIYYKERYEVHTHLLALTIYIENKEMLLCKVRQSRFLSAKAGEDKQQKAISELIKGCLNQCFSKSL